MGKEPTQDEKDNKADGSMLTLLSIIVMHLRLENLQREMIRCKENLLEYNRFPRIYRQAYEVLKEASMVTDQDMNIQAHLHYALRIDSRRYNLPSLDEFAVILPGDGQEPCSIRDIVVYLKAGQELMRIS
ncbi:hypothetical protein GIB67_041526 [Kingdonia uniflora]|uniref:Uncharacterized protein n=1 Tax=Kingdonia uniflora TaxID=39325 RepID=A0A7J7MQ54_9MAGN|nr:hypothetical protein GIB67_041526 [Kingdonia uniflora]